MFEPIGNTKPVKYPQQAQGMFNALNSGLPEYVWSDANKLYVKLMSTPGVELKHSLPIARRIVEHYVTENRNFDADEIVTVYLKYGKEIPSYIESYKRLKVTHSEITDPEAEALAEAVIEIAAELGIESDTKSHKRLKENLK